MDRSLKERLIGAIVLVVVAVLVVPVFLDGPSGDDDTVTEQVTLPGQNDQPRMQQTIVLERDREEPVPAAAPPPEAEPAAPPRPEPAVQQSAETTVPEKAAKTVAKAVAESPLEASPEPAAESGAGLWAVQLGSFSSRENAEKLAADLRSEGFAAFLSKLNTSAGELHRVRVGPQKDRDAAESVATTLASAGHKGQVVTHP